MFSEGKWVVNKDQHGSDTQSRDWHRFQGHGVTIYAPQDSYAAYCAPAILWEAEHLLDQLHRILMPDQENGQEPIAVFVSDTEAAKERDVPPVPDLSQKSGDCIENEPIVLIVQPKIHPDSIAAPLTRCCVQRWFGHPAASAPLMITGIAGLAAARSGIGPTAVEGDQWVHSELEAKRSVAIVEREFPASSSISAETNTAIEPAMTSFLAFLTARYGLDSLKRYLSAYNPDCQDQAAYAAFQQPLAVLEEEWLIKLRRRGNGGNNFRSFLLHVLPLLKPYRWKQLEILFYLLLAAAFNIVQPYAIKTVIDRVSEQIRLNVYTHGAGEVFTRTLAPFLLLLLVIYALDSLVSLRRAYTVNWLNQNILNTLQVRMYAHLQRLSHNFYTHAKTGDLMTRLDDDLDNVQSALSQVTNKALYQIFTVVGALTALFMLTRKSPELAIPILFIIPIFAANYMALRTRNKQASREQRQRVGQTMAVVQENLSAHAVIKAFGMEGKTLSGYKSRILSLQKSKLRLALLSALTDLSEDMTTALAQLIVFGVGGYLVLRDHNHGLGVGDLSALLVLVKSIFSPIASLSGIGQTMQQATGAIERVEELFQEPIAIEDRPGAADLPAFARAIRFENVTFRYDDSRVILKDLSFTIPAGSHVAIVGPSGSGKSTLINLLLRFWDPDEGRILFNIHDLRDITLVSLRSQIGLVFQETFIFNTTLRANIAIGRPDATDAEIAAAANAAQLHGFIESLPGGYNTIPGENGARLSVGQKQRIAIARAFLRNPPILILDEATSALDAQTDADILETLSELAKGRTTISITHRIAQAAQADHILVLEAGRLVEQGTHENLVKAGGLYQKLYEEASDFVVSNSHHKPFKAVTHVT